MYLYCHIALLKSLLAASRIDRKRFHRFGYRLHDRVPVVLYVCLVQRCENYVWRYVANNSDNCGLWFKPLFCKWILTFRRKWIFYLQDWLDPTRVSAAVRTWNHSGIELYMCMLVVCMLIDSLWRDHPLYLYLKRCGVQIFNGRCYFWAGTMYLCLDIKWWTCVFVRI